MKYVYYRAILDKTGIPVEMEREQWLCTLKMFFPEAGVDKLILQIAKDVRDNHCDYKYSPSLNLNHKSNAQIVSCIFDVNTHSYDVDCFVSEDSIYHAVEKFCQRFNLIGTTAFLRGKYSEANSKLDPAWKPTEKILDLLLDEIHYNNFDDRKAFCECLLKEYLLKVKNTSIEKSIEKLEKEWGRFYGNARMNNLPDIENNTEWDNFNSVQGDYATDFLTELTDIVYEKFKITTAFHAHGRQGKTFYPAEFSGSTQGYSYKNIDLEKIEGYDNYCCTYQFYLNIENTYNMFVYVNKLIRKAAGVDWDKWWKEYKENNDFCNYEEDEAINF